MKKLREEVRDDGHGTLDGKGFNIFILNKQYSVKELNLSSTDRG